MLVSIEESRGSTRRILLILINIVSVYLSASCKTIEVATAPIIFSHSVFYVDTNHLNASDKNVGNAQSAPLKTIVHAANIAKAGDVIYIKRGVYNDGDIVIANSGTAGLPITLSAYPGHEHRVVVEQGQVTIIRKNYINISGIKVQNSRYGFYAEGPLHHLTLSNNYTYNTFSSGIIVWGVAWQTDPGTYENAHDIIIENNKIEKACNGGWNEMITLANGIYNFRISNNEIFNGGNPINGGEGIDVKEGIRDGEISGNLIHGISRRGIYLDAGGILDYPAPSIRNVAIFNNAVHSSKSTPGFAGVGGMAIMTEGGGDIFDIDVYDNIFHNTNEDGILLYDHPAGTGNIYRINVINNIIYANARYGILLDFPRAYGLVFRNNIVYKNTVDDLVLSNGKYTADDNIIGVDPLAFKSDSANYFRK